jgi:hypothetical protein
MPSIAEFLGMVIYMYWDEHPPAHFHVRFGGIWAQIDIRTGQLMDGALPRKKLKKVDEWRKLHIEELLENWEIVARNGSPHKIDTL